MKLSALKYEPWGVEFTVTREVEGVEKAITYRTDETYTGLWVDMTHRGQPDNQIIGHLQLDLTGSNARDHVIRWLVKNTAGYRTFLGDEMMNDSLRAARLYWRYTDNGADIEE